MNNREAVIALVALAQEYCLAVFRLMQAAQRAYRLLGSATAPESRCALALGAVAALVLRKNGLACGENLHGRGYDDDGWFVYRTFDETRLADRQEFERLVILRVQTDFLDLLVYVGFGVALARVFANLPRFQ